MRIFAKYAKYATIAINRYPYLTSRPNSTKIDQLLDRDDLFPTATRPCTTPTRPLTTSTQQPTRSLLHHHNPYTIPIRSLLDLNSTFTWPLLNHYSISVYEVFW